MGRTVAIVQARMGSTRLPGKVMAQAAGRPLLATMLDRVAGAQRLDDVWIATTDDPRDEPIVALARAAGVPVFRGSEHDVLARYAGAAAAADADVVVRLTSDCPLIDPAVVDRVVGALDGHDLATNAPPTGRTYPDGMDVEAMPAAVLRRADAEATAQADREHVTRYLHGGGFDVHVVHFDAPLGDVRITVDTPEDLAVVERLLDDLPAGFALADVLAALGR